MISSYPPDSLFQITLKWNNLDRSRSCKFDYKNLETQRTHYDVINRYKQFTTKLLACW